MYIDGVLDIVLSIIMITFYIVITVFVISLLNLLKEEFDYEKKKNEKEC